MHDEGIILRRSGSVLALITKERGRVDRLFFPKRFQNQLSLGTIFSYCEKKRQSARMCGQPIIEEFVVEHVPLEWARCDIHLLHYVLEICYFFMPIDGGGKTMFALVKEIYRNFNLFLTQLQQKIVVCKLLAHLGVIPDSTIIHQYALMLLNTPVDKVDLFAEKVVEQDFEEWIEWALKAHKEGQWFKAVPLLLKS